MQKYRKKPIIIEAIEWDERSETFENLCNKGMNYMSYSGGSINFPHIKNLRIETPQGTLNVNNGDFIIKGIKGEFYPCKPDIFQKTYDKAED